MRQLVAMVVLVAGTLAQQGEDRLRPYLAVLRQDGADPIRFVVQKLDAFDLLIFDDALHTAVEPFEFYQQLVKDTAFQRHSPAIFLEAIPSNKQRYLDAYLAVASDDPSILYRAFQDDANGLGFPYRTYFDLLRTIRGVNQTLAETVKLKIYAAGSPTFWSEIQTRQDLEQFHKSLASYDHHMYMTIVNELGQFRANKKGIFLTNTRHAYKGIKRKDGQFFWNTGTFFHERHPGKSYSIRVHNVALSIEAIKKPDPAAAKTAQGMEQIEYKFVRMAHGLWDSAFHAWGDRPVAFPIVGNVFGEEPYIGNHQLDALPGQKMQDAYEAVVFIAPIEKLRQTAMIDGLYTATFKRELKRRYQLLYNVTQLAELLKKNDVADLDGLMAKTLVARPEQPLPQAATVGPIDEWKRLSANK